MPSGRPALTAVTLALLVAAPAASGATWTVTSTADRADARTGDSVCDTREQVAPVCTLRAAIEEANGLTRRGRRLLARRKHLTVQIRTQLRRPDGSVLRRSG